MSGMPRRITISEVGPRDGLQIERTLVPAAIKIGLIERLVAAGIDRIEVSAFVHPKVVPQMADAEEVFAGLQRRPGVRYGALVFNTPRRRARHCRRVSTSSRSAWRRATASTSST